MEDLRSCLFCGKGVDRDFVYCPWCGYEFSPGEEPTQEEDDPAEERPDDCRDGSSPSKVAEWHAAAAAAALPGVLARLCTLEQKLTQIEEELDLMLRSVSADP